MNRRRTALVTGASRGIGRSFAYALASRSWDLVLVARSEQLLRELATELSSRFGIHAEAIAVDLTSPTAAEELVRQTEARGIPIELLVNNAGFGETGEFSSASYERQSGMARLNTVALVELTHRFLPSMLARRSGAIINVSSTAGFQPMPFAAVYAATKAFVTSFSVALAEEVRMHGIRVVTLCPGPTRTESNAGDEGGAPGGRQPAEEVVAEALKQLDGNGGIVVPRLINKALAVSRYLPLELSAKLVGRLLGGKKP
jgi:hypothetical protein